MTTTTRDDRVRQRIAAARRRMSDNDFADRIPHRGEAGRVASFSQERMWLLEQLLGGKSDYHSYEVLRLRGPVDLDALRESFTFIAERHEVLRTVFVEDDGTPRPVVLPPRTVPLPVTDLSGEPHEMRWSRALDHAKAAITEPFDLRTGPVLRVRAIRLADNDHVLVLVAHHIAVDGWSMRLLWAELSTAYRGRLAGTTPDLPPLPIQYGDYAAWTQRQDAAGELDYWRRTLAGATATELPTDRPRPAAWSGRGDLIEFAIAPDLAERIDRLATDLGATIFMTLHAALTAVLARHANSTDITIGTPIAGRTRPETEALIGFFVNTLVLRTDLTGDPTFAELVRRVRDTAVAAYQHQEIPFEAVLQELLPDRDLSRNPLFQILFVQGEDETEMLDLEHLTVERVSVNVGTSLFDLTVGITRRGSRLEGTAFFATDLYDRATVERFLDHVLRFLDSATARPDSLISTIELLDETEYQLLTRGWNDTAADCPDQSLHGLVDEQAARTPDAIALADLSGTHLTYAELVSRANQVAHRLRAAGAGPDVPVGIWLDRTADCVVTLLAILKAGSAYVPIDPDVPPARAVLLLGEAGAPIVCTTPDRAHHFAGTPTTAVTDSPTEAPIDPTTTAPAVRVHPDNLVSIYYTSGSTGTPKGVASTHRGWVNRMHWLQHHHHPLGPGDSVLHKTILSFDDSAEEIFWPLLGGARIVLLPPGLHRDPLAMVRAAAEQEISVLLFVPSMLTMFLDEITPAYRERLTALRYVVSCGEALRPELVARFYERLAGTRARLYNFWGTTEVSIDSTIHACEPADGHATDVPIGRPISNNQVYVLDRHLNPAPVGAPGDLYLAGAGLARGYLRDPRRTAKAFIPHPYAPGQRLYRTGDQGIRRHDGSLSILGRADHQIKIRGVRIEPGEIEHALRLHPDVHDAAVTTWEPTPGDQRLAACISPGFDDVERLIDHLARLLPRYLIPTSYTPIAEIPTTASGKVDRNRLPTPVLATAATRTPPGTATERLVASVWADVLSQSEPDIHTNFFALGGHSLLATKVIARLRTMLGVELPLTLIFDHPTVHMMARVLDEQGIAGSAEGTGGSRQADVQPAHPRGSADAPLSSPQRRLWFLQQLRPESVEYNVPTAARLRGRLDIGALRAALVTLVERHEVLRSRILPDDRPGGLPRQRPEPPDVFSPIVTDLRWAGVDAERRARELATDDAHHPFDLTEAPWLRARVIRITDDDHLLVLVAHHIATDGWSLPLMWRELSAIYRASTTSQLAPLPALPIQYGDYAAWSEGHYTEQALAAQLDFWRTNLAGATATEPPSDRPRPPTRSGHGARLTAHVPASATVELEAVARTRGCTVFMALVAAFVALLARHTNSADITIGTPIAGRTRPETEPLIGFFVNTLLLRTDVSGNPTFNELLDRVRSTAVAAYQHQDVPFDDIVEALQPERDLSRNPLFNIMFALNDGQDATVDLPGLAAESIALNTDTAKFDLDVALMKRGDQLEGVFTYATDLLEGASVRRLADQYVRFIEQVAADPARRVWDLSLFAPDEEETLRSRWNDTAVPYPDRCLPELVEDQAARTPDAVALIGPDVTYGELVARANQLAHRLRAAGAGPDAPVAVLADRTPDCVVILLAVLKAGAAYLPLDPSYPADRLAYMLSDSGVRALVDHRAQADPPPGVEVVDPASVAEFPRHAPAVTVRADDLAYLMYTSGSTGRPKAVMVPHRGLASFAHDMAGRLGLGMDDTVCAVTTIAFDISVLELLVPLTCGARVAVVDRDTAADGGRLAARLRECSATVLQATPATWHLLLLAGWTGAGLRTAVCGGEAMPGKLARELLDRVPDVWNVYGPTETTIWSTAHRLAEPVTAPVPIGSPIANTVAHVLDHRLRLTPVGAVGELYLGGVGVTRGYAGQPRLTAERFRPDPYGNGQRLYATGDLARRTAAGLLEYVGRADAQVKIRGHRIELGEVEAVLQQYPGVTRAAVTAPGAGTDRRLAGYVVWRDEPDEAGLSAHLRDRLPSVMVPSVIVGLDALPLTPNGKLDRAKLPKPEAPGQVRTVTPRDVLELRMATIWQRVLDRSQVGVRDDFFALGGHSLRAFELVEAIRSELGVDVPLNAVFREPTVEGLCAALPAATATDSLLVPMAGGDDNDDDPPLFLVHPHSGDVCCYVDLARALGAAGTVYGIEAIGYNDDTPPLPSIGQMADRYVAEIRKAVPHGPYALLGWSFGGNLAFEMAVLLERAGETVGLLGILDAEALGSREAGPAEDEIIRFGAVAGLSAEQLDGLDEDEIIRALVRHSHENDRRPQRLRSAAMRRTLAVARANGRAAASYRTDATVATDIHLFTVSQAHPTLDSPSVSPAAWQSRTRGRLHEIPVPGNHHDLVYLPHAAVLAEKIVDVLQKEALWTVSCTTTPA